MQAVGFHLPIGPLVAFTVVAGVLAAIPPARRASRLDVLHALQCRRGRPDALLTVLTGDTLVKTVSEFEHAEAAPEAVVAPPAALGAVPQIAPASPGAILKLQQTAGNRAVNRLMAGRRHVAAGVRPVALMRQAAPLTATEREFKDRVSSGGTLPGQFVFTVQLLRTVDAAVRATISAGPWSDAEERRLAQKAVDDYWPLVIRHRWKDAEEHLLAIHRFLDASTAAAAPLLRGHLGTLADARKSVGLQLYNTFWREFRRPGGLRPDMGAFRLRGKSIVTLAHVLALDRFERIACGPTAAHVASKYIAGDPVKAGLRHKSKKLRSRSLTTGKKPRNLTPDPATALVRGDEFIYTPHLPAIVNEMKDSLADGWAILARVNSGTLDDGSRHTVVIFEFEAGPAGRPTFIFYDPDVAGSNTRRTGFGRVYHADKRLTTAATDADFPVTLARGFHAGGAHRYQVLSVEGIG